MAYVNVAEWKTDQVCEWLKGLDNSVLPYVHSFTNNCVNGQQLLNLRPEDLEQLGVLKLGHQEIILEAVEYLRNFHYELDRENLQLLALHLSCQAHSLHNELSRHTDSKPVMTQTLSDVASVVTAVKPLVRWLDRPPFSGQLEYNDKKSELLKLSLEMATCAQRDRFAEKPIEEIRSTCEQLAKLADYIIQDIADPMILQPASLDLATLKKRPGDDLGFYILPSFHGTHQIAEIKFGSAAHTCGKMEEGDEIVQVNYQTVVGWERKNVLELFSESPIEVLLTLKRRPRHTKVYGQIYIKPYRLPSNKKTPYATRWQHNLPSPRPELLTIPDFTMPLPRHVPKEPSPEPAGIIDTVGMLDTMATDSSDSDSEVEPPLSVRLYASKPRNLVQRRATITGASPTTKHGIDIEQFWKELKQEHSTTFQLRDKAASCAHGLDSIPSNLRPQTCLGIEQTKRKKRTEERIDERKVQFNDKLCENDNSHDDIVKNVYETNQQPNNRRDRDVPSNNTGSNNNYSDITVPLDKCDDVSLVGSTHEKDIMNANDIGIRCRKERGKLDKSYSTPAYDLTEPTLIDIIDTREHRSKINNVGCNCAASSTPSIIVNETDSRVSNDSLESNGKETKEHRRDIVELNETNDTEILGSVAQRVNYIESYIHKNEDRSNGTKLAEEHGKNNVRKACTNENQNSIDTDRKSEGIDATREKIEASEGGDIPNKITFEYAELGRESSEEKSESTGSYMEGTYSSSSDADVPMKKMMESEALIAHGFAERNDTSSISSTLQNRRMSDGSDIKAGRAQKFELSVQNCKERCDVVIRDCVTTPTMIRESTETSKAELPKKPETKLRLTPPEPPPRKYFSKPLPLNLSAVSNSLDIREQPKVPDRADSRTELRKVDQPLDIPTMQETLVNSNHRDGFEGYRDFVEKSTDFIDEPTISTHEQKTHSLIDHYGYTEIYEGQTKDEKSGGERYEPFNEKFGNGIAVHSAGEHVQLEFGARSVDSPDGSGCSRQALTPDSKPKTLEKDKHCEKGVVNRAMMVARSIGLHSGSNKSSSSSSSSPRSSRKRNLLLAKRRNVSVKDVGPGDLEGWLTYRSRGAGGAWARSWFVLKSSSLYRFKAQDSTKSDCLIALPGFTASTAAEVKSRKYAFKVYHTGTVFYFAADTEDCLALWLDSINKATLGADSHNRTSGLFSETDESDGETKTKPKGTTNNDTKGHETMFGSLKKIGRKDSGYKDHEIGGASLDRKYLRFLGARNQNVPVPTAQFRSYRRVLPTSTPNRKQDSTPNSPDLRVTVAGSTFYGLSASQSATDVPSTSQDMGDYRQTTDRLQNFRGRRTDDLRGFVTLEEFMLSHQNEDRNTGTSNRSASPRITPLTSDHVHIQHRHFDDNGVSHMHGRSFDASLSNGMIYGHPRNGEESSSTSSFGSAGASYEFTRSTDGTTERGSKTNIGQKQEITANASKSDERNGEKSTFGITRRMSYNNKKSFVSSCAHNRRTQEGAVYYPSKQNDLSHWQNVSNEIVHEQHRTNMQQQCANRTESALSRCRKIELMNVQEGQCAGSWIQPRNENKSNDPTIREHCQSRESCVVEAATANVQSVPRRFVRDNGYVGSSGDLTCCASSSETLQRARKEASISRKGSFNLTDRRREHISPDKHWIDSLRRNDKKNNGSVEKSRLKNVAQYQPPPIPGSPFEQDGMRAAFEMHLDKGEQVHKTNRLKSLFGSKSPQKPNTLDLPKESPKTLLGSPRLHRALFRDKSGSQQQRQNIRSGSQSPGDSGISQSLSSYSGNSQSHTLSQSFSSVSSVSDWSPDTPTPNSSKCLMGHPACQKRFSNSNRSSLTPPTLPYIPPPTSPPPDDYPGLEYPPVFEPGTYSLTDASLIRNRKTSQNKSGRESEDAG